MKSKYKIAVFLIVVLLCAAFFITPYLSSGVRGMFFPLYILIAFICFPGIIAISASAEWLHLPFLDPSYGHNPLLRGDFISVPTNLGLILAFLLYLLIFLFIRFLYQRHKND